MTLIPKLTENGKPAEAAPRVKTEGRLKVVSKTLGTRYQYQFDTHNASSSGLLLASTDGGIPFLQNTIIEMTIDPECNWSQRPVLALGKVIRREVVGPTEEAPERPALTRIGVQIVQIDSDHLLAWDACRERLGAA